MMLIMIPSMMSSLMSSQGNYFRASLLFGIVIFFVSLQVVAESNKTDRTYISNLRYIKNGPSRAQVDPLSEVLNIKFSRYIRTVGHAVRYVIARSGYHISPSNLAEQSTQLLMHLPLPQVQRRLKPMTLRQALAVLIGDVYRIEVNPVSRSLSFKVKKNYKTLLAAALADYQDRKKLQKKQQASLHESNKIMDYESQIRKTESQPRDNSANTLLQKISGSENLNSNLDFFSQINKTCSCNPD